MCPAGPACPAVCRPLPARARVPWRAMDGVCRSDVRARGDRAPDPDHTPACLYSAPEEDRGFLTRTGSVVCSCRFCASAAAEHWQLRTARANTTRRVNPSGPREVTLCAALCLQKGRRRVSAVFRHVL